MISTGLPRWPDRDAAGPSMSFKITVRCDERTSADNDIAMTPLPAGAQITAPAAWQTDWRGGMAVWPDEIADKPDPTGQSWWAVIGIALFVAANAAIWCVGLAALARRIIDSGTPFP